MTVSKRTAARNGAPEAESYAKRKSRWLLQVASDRRQDLTSTRVAIALASWLNPNEGDDVWPAQETIAGRANLVRSNVPAAIRLLVDNGHLTVRKVGKNNRYSIVLKADEGDAGNGEDVEIDAEKSPDDPQMRISPDASSASHGMRVSHPVGCTNSKDSEESSKEPDGASAPFGLYPSHSETEEETRSPEGARLADHEPAEEAARVSDDDALDEIARAFDGPIGDRDMAYNFMVIAVNEGIYYDQLVHEARHQDDPAVTLEDFLWRMTEHGRRARGQEARTEEGAIPV